MSETATVRLTTTGMHCQSCSMLVQMELEDLGGVESAVSDFRTGITDVAYDPSSVTIDELIAAVVRAGYGAEVA
jgi:copper chaperone CopZ